MGISDDYAAIFGQYLPWEMRWDSERKSIAIGHIFEPLYIAAEVLRRAFHFDHQQSARAVQAHYVGTPSVAQFKLNKVCEADVFKPTANAAGYGCCDFRRHRAHLPFPRGGNPAAVRTGHCLVPHENVPPMFYPGLAPYAGLDRAARALRGGKALSLR